MILIFREDKDVSAIKVIDWLEELGVGYLSLTESESIDILESINFQENEIEILLNIKNKIYNLKDFKIVWFRRSNLFFSLSDIKHLKIGFNKEFRIKVREHLEREISSLSNFIYD